MTRRAVLLLLALVAGAAMAIAAMPLIVPRLQNDSSELCDIVHSLRRERTSIAVFGNSTGQEAIDGARIGGKNFCSSAQTLAESFFLQQELPASTKTIVQVVASWQLERETPFEPDHLTMLKMCGWRSTAATREAFARAFGEDWATDVDDRPLRDRFAARSHVRAAIEIFMRERLSPSPRGRRWRAAPDEGLGERESGFAEPLTRPSTPLSRGERGKMLTASRGERGKMLTVSRGEREKMLALSRGARGQRLILAEAVAAARRDGRRFVVVLAPLRRPDRAFVASMQGVAPEVIDLTELLAPDEFRDATHANAAGRRKVSEAVAARLR